MFQSRTGWLGVLVSLIGVLTAADVMPLVSQLLTDTLGAQVSHGVGLFLSLLGTVVAKLSSPERAPTGGDAPGDTTGGNDGAG